MNHPSVYRVKKIDQGCVSACLYSFLVDRNGLIPCAYSLRDFQNYLIGRHVCSRDGIVQCDKVPAACTVVGIAATRVQYDWSLATPTWNGSLLICTHQHPVFHCVRFDSQPEPTKMLFMDPEDGTYRWLDQGRFHASNPICFQLRCLP